mgnify:FL=1
MLSYKLSQLLDKVIERCFRHIAMGRRNWLQTGRHFSAQNLAFMFGLLESCKLNKVNFGEYIVNILTRILCGEEVDALANAIIALLKDEAKREKRQINFVGDKSWKVITEKYIEFYKTII